MEYRKNVSAVVFRHNAVLIIKKPKHPSWAFPQGGIEDNESEETALKRELKEELNLENIEIIGKSRFVHAYDWPEEKQKKSGLKGIKQNIYFVKINDNNDIKIDPKELEDYKWVKPEEILDYLKYDNLVDLVNNILSEIKENTNQSYF